MRLSKLFQKILGDKVKLLPMVNNLNIVKSIGLIGLKNLN